MTHMVEESGVAKKNVTKSNDLVKAAYKLTLNEQRLLLAAISRIDPRKPMPRPISITAPDFAEQYDLPLKHAYEALKEATSSLYERDIKTYDGRYKSRFRWVDRVDYLDGGGETKLYFTVHVQPYLVHLNKSFTTYELKRISDLSSAHSIRLFELLQQFKSTGFYTVSVDAFRELLELGPSYERYSNLKLKVLDPAIAELREKSGLIIEFSTKKKGRAINRLIFKFRDDDQMRLNFAEPVDSTRNP